MWHEVSYRYENGPTFLWALKANSTRAARAKFRRLFSEDAKIVGVNATEPLKRITDSAFKEGEYTE
jgi:hypothetical protein